jgi:hypothetical protein
MGWGIARKRVYDLFLWLTCQALADKDTSGENLVSEVNLSTWEPTNSFDS